MPHAFGRRNRSVHFALTLILGAFILGFLFYHPEPDTDAEKFSTERLHIKQQLTTPTPTIEEPNSSQITPEATSIAHSHVSPPVEYSNKTMVAFDRTCVRSYKVGEAETINDITRAQSVATLELLSESGLNFPVEGPLTAGTPLCLPKKCKLAHLSDDQTCHNFATEALAQREVLAWNPSAAKGLETGSLCSSLEVIGGVYICMSEPGKEVI